MRDRESLVGLGDGARKTSGSSSGTPRTPATPPTFVGVNVRSCSRTPDMSPS